MGKEKTRRTEFFEWVAYQGKLHSVVSHATKFRRGKRFSLWGRGEPCYVPKGGGVVLNGEKSFPDGFKGG